MNRYCILYQEIARVTSLERGRFVHKLVGSTPIRSLADDHDKSWLDAAESSAWPVIYGWHYLRDRRRSEDTPSRPMIEREDAEFVARLSSANLSSGLLDDNWLIVGRDGSEYFCEKGDFRLRVPDSQLHTTAGHSPNSGTIRFPAERRHWLPDYYCIASGATKQPDFRVYFNVKSACADWLLRCLTGELGQAGVSYQLKVLNNPMNYTRPDAAVLYMSAAALDICRAVVARISGNAATAMRSFVPALTRQISHGIAVADEPASNSDRRPSFGEHRCRIIARGLARAYASEYKSITERVRMISREFENEGLDPERPFSAPSNGVAAHF